MSIDRFLMRYMDVYNTLVVAENSFYRSFYLDGNHVSIDYTKIPSVGYLVIGSELKNYVRTKTKSYMLQPCESELDALARLRSLPEMRRVFTSEARSMGISDIPGTKLLAACLAGYFDLPKAQRGKLCGSSEVFKIVEKEFEASFKLRDNTGTWFAEWQDSLPYAANDRNYNDSEDDRR